MDDDKIVDLYWARSEQAILETDAITISYQSTDSPETMAYLQQLLSNQIDLEEKSQ